MTENGKVKTPTREPDEWGTRKGEEKPKTEGFIAQKACDGKAYLPPRTPLGMTAHGDVKSKNRPSR